jgi:hypothetical protein
VAVFDAGFDLQDKRLTKRAPLDGAQPGIVGFKDFVDPFASTMKDYASNKHGTEMAGWVMNIMPLAKVYVARVLYGDKAAAGARREDDCIVEVIKAFYNLIPLRSH